ncbi:MULTISPECIES: AraC family transcriptional regulator [unclassified Roseofilum]|uniref:AraC family transcriptional regulator n=1 Tax=unclassified Roseofilum TaxID=2620099 RepID=UPI000E9166D9|nr:MULTISPECIES: AraC family transcriptional regulator [unclassified Roseofilum]HBQ99074.1 AraC family transcriptional regulator [Cyanobacteria bacterium UBA11691]MBP0007907.1 AraC family transcriptional regulator [Roseofilum sp. Belize Diploria]MBP0014036.1 AraC family transcriptional regulator [Roseofilum sp. SID3]MBP0023082.1 AraC family transcriptional regulator [Roseofilum sp. SID2]MBP0032314.1 AraC family transcriptional regulator [Roseofilum sp. Belize BBD 4]
MAHQISTTEQVKFWRDPVLNDLEMLHATYITYSFSRHAHEGFGIAIVESGAMEFEYEGETYIAPPGSVVVTQPGAIHTGGAVLETGWTYRTLLPAADWLQQAATELAERPKGIPYFASPLIHDKHLNRLLLQLHRSLEAMPSPLERESRFLWGMAQLINAHASDRSWVKPIGQEHSTVERVREYLNTNYHANISLEELANLVDLTPLRLLRTFRKQVGLPPHTYLNQVRVYQAKRLLAAGWSIINTALETGFTDQSHLHRHFKKIVGLTPGQYVRGCKNVQD